MRYAKLVFLGALLLVLPALAAVSVLADEAPTAPPANDIQPAGPAFDQLTKLQAAGYDKLYYVIIRNFQMVGWAKSELAVGVWENQPVIEQTLASSYTDGVLTKVEGKIYYNGNLEVQGIAESYTVQNQVTTLKATRKDKALEVEVQPQGGEAKKSEVVVEGLPEPPVNVYALVLRYFGQGLKEDATITVLNDNNLAAFTPATAQMGGKYTAIMQDVRLARCAAVVPDQANRYLLELKTGLVARKDVAFNMAASASQFIVDKATFDNWVVNGKWNEAAKAIAKNVATLLPQPAKAIPDWNAKRAELEKHWKELADKIPAEQVEEMKAFIGALWDVKPANLTQEQKDKLAKFGDNLAYYILAQALNDEDPQAAQMRFSILARAMQVLFPDKFPQEVRDSLVSTLYDEMHATDQTLPALLADRAWDADMQDVFVDRIMNSKGESMVDQLCMVAIQKQLPWTDQLGLYMLTNNMGYTFPAVSGYMGSAVNKPLYIGLLFERCRLGTLNNPDMWSAQALDKILAQQQQEGDMFAFYYEFYCKWHTALFAGATPTEEIKKKAEDLFVKLDAEDLATREAAKKDLIAMGKVILPLLEAQRENNSPEIRQAVVDITDQIVAPGYSKTVEYIKKNEFDRNLAIFIGYLACQTPSMRAEAAAKLRALTGQDFGEDLAKWFTWYQANKDKLKWNKDKNIYTTE
jgi:hypothetical protein